MELTVLGHREPPFLLVEHPPLSLTTSESLVHAGKKKEKNDRAHRQAQLLRLSSFAHITTQRLRIYEGEVEQFLASGAC